MQTFLTLAHEYETDLPAPYDGGVRTPPSYVEHFLREHSAAGDTVLDPFAGFGTTLVVAERLGREAWGVEFEPDRVEYVRGRVDHPERVVNGDALDLSSDDVPAFDCCLTSPPFMVEGMTENPFENYAGESDYATYLDDLETVFGRLAALAADDARLLVDVSNLKHEGDVTTLAWDVADAAATHFRFDGEVVVGWEGDGRAETEGSYGYGYDHSYCLTFEVE